MRVAPSLLVLATTLAWPVQASRAQEDCPVVPSRVTSVGLFKNGLAVVRRTVMLPGAGTFEIADIPEPVHGTLWIESEAQLETRVTTRLRDVPLGGPSAVNLPTDLAGRRVTIHFRDGGIPPASGRVLQAEGGHDRERWDRTYEQPSRDRWGWWSSAPRTAPSSGGMTFMILDTSEGTVFIDPSQIAYLSVDEPVAITKRRQPALLVTAASPMKTPIVVDISYLTKGMAWAPSYRVDLSDAETLAIEQKAVIRNELEDLQNVEIQLISGFPSVEFSHVLSPMSPETTWSAFFRQLGQQFQPAGGRASVMAQQAVVSNFWAPSYGGGEGAVDTSAVWLGDGVDLHHHSIGPRTLMEGDTLCLSVAAADSPYERIVEWVVPDTRDEYGRYYDEYYRQQHPEKFNDVGWDAIRFANPFSFPMTTGPAMIVAHDRFNGQHMVHWVNPAEQTTLRITKALSIRTRSGEQEEPGEREIVTIGGRNFRHPRVRGELVLTNHRAKPVTMVVRRQFSGELIKAEGSPQLTLREEGVYSVNQRHELTWTITLAPGEERTLTYRYSVLVYH